MHQDILERKEVADKFATYLQNLAIKGQIESLSITIRDWNSDNLFQYAHSLGIRELSVTAHVG